MNSSKVDIDLTNKIKEGGKMMDIQLLDHLIISPVDREGSIIFCRCRDFMILKFLYCSINYFD